MEKEEIYYTPLQKKIFIILAKDKKWINNLS